MLLDDENDGHGAKDVKAHPNAPTANLCRKDLMAMHAHEHHDSDLSYTQAPAPAPAGQPPP
jgi:hypothetical protein